MENNQATAGGDAPAVISIEYYGEAGEDAERLRSALAQSPAKVTGVSERGSGQVDMVAAEIIITIAAAAAAKAVASTALGYLEDYVRQQIEAKKSTPDIQVVIKREDGKTMDRVPFSFATMGLETVAAFSKNLRGAIDKI